MKVFEFTKKKNMENLDPVARQFTAKMIMNEVKRIAEEKGISEQLAYELYSKGMFDADREI